MDRGQNPGGCAGAGADLGAGERGPAQLPHGGWQ